MSDGTEDEEYEGFVKMLPNPILPTQQMIDMHMVTHTHTHLTQISVHIVFADEAPCMRTE